MTIAYHPCEELLMQFASGALKPPSDIPLRAHLDDCVLCRNEATVWEGVGGALLEEIEPVAMKNGALESALSIVKTASGRSGGVWGIVNRAAKPKVATIRL